MLNEALMQRPAAPLSVLPTESLLRQSLPTTVRTAAGQWRCRDAEWSDRAQDWESLASMKHLPDATTILKHEPNKLICRQRAAHELESESVVKITAARRFNWRLNPRRRWDAEARNLLCAAARGLNVPQLFACGTVGSRLGQRHAVLVMQYLPWQSLRDQFASPQSDDDKWCWLRRAALSLQRLYQSGCVHIDFGPHAVLLSPVSDAEDVVFDLELAGFVPHPSPEVWAAQAGYFSWSVATNQSWVAPQMIECWFDEQLRAQRFANPDRLWTIWRQHSAARETTGRRLAWR